MAGSKLLQAIAAYERQREAVEGWSQFIHACERVEPQFWHLLKRWTDKPRGRGAA